MSGGPVSVALPVARGGRPRPPRVESDARVGVRGERFALATAAVAVATLPLLAPHGPSNTAPEDVLILLAIGAALLWVGRSGSRLRFAYGIPMAVFVAGGALGALAGPVPGAGVQAIVQDFALVAWCWTFMNVASEPRRLKVLLTTWAYSSIVWTILLFVGLGAGITFLSGQTPREGSRTALTFGDPNVSANYYVISMMIVCAIGRPRHRAWRFGAYALFVSAVLSTGSNSGVVSLVVATSVATVLGVHRRSGMPAAIGAAALLLTGGALVATNISLKSIQQKAYGSRFAFIRDGIGRSGLSVDQRSMLLHESIGLLENEGPLGEGPVSTKVRLQAEMAPFVKEAHNDYLAALTERGAIGAAGLLLLIIGLVIRGTAVAKTGLNTGFGAIVRRPNAVLGALAGTMVTQSVYELLHVRHVWTLFAIIAVFFVWGRR